MVVKIPVLRLGDTSKVSIVRVHTKDGSATSGEDYHPVSEGMKKLFGCHSDQYHILLIISLIVIIQYLKEKRHCELLSF